MSDVDEAFEEHWAANFVRHMARAIEDALATQDGPARRRALESAMAWGREARVRIESGRTDDAGERAALSHLERALDEVQAILNRVEIGYDPLLRTALDDAWAAADCLAEV